MSENEKEPKEQTISQVAPERPDEAPVDEAIVDAVYKDLQELCAKHNIEESVVVFRFKEIDKPFLFWTNPNNDHYYEATRLIASVMRDMKGRIVQELDC
jgi:hypothetical protein